MSRRNIWTDEETKFFLELLKNKQILSILDGKKFRAMEVFKSLEKEMKATGYDRDAAQMKTKFKNLKGEYYKVKRHNEKSGVDPTTFLFYDDMVDLLKDRPTGNIKGVDSSADFQEEEESRESPGYSSQEEFGDETQQLNTQDSVEEQPEVEVVCTLDEYGNIAEAFPPGVPSSCKDTPRTKNSVTKDSTTKDKEYTTPSRKKLGQIQQAVTEVKESVNKALSKITEIQDNDNTYLDKLMKSQENMLTQCTKNFIEGLKSVFKKKSKRKRHYSSSSSSSSSSSDELEVKKKRKL